MKTFVRPIVAVLVAVLVTLLIGLNVGFPQEPDQFKQNAERLHQAALAGENLDNELVHEGEVGPSIVLSDRSLTSDFVRVLKWYSILLATMYFMALVISRSAVKETSYVSAAASIILLFLVGPKPAALLAVGAVVYVLMHLIFMPRAKRGGGG